MQGNIQFVMDFPKGEMVRPGVSLNHWTAKGVQSKAVFTLPDGSVAVLTEEIPDTYAVVQPLEGTGSVGAFQNKYTLTITPPSA